MKVFHCDHCESLVFFENTGCLACGRRLAYLPDLAVIGSLDDSGDGTFTSPLPRADGKRYHLCANYAKHDTCNWAVCSGDADEFCTACRLTTVIPDIDVDPSLKEKWYKLEVAKRRLVYTLGKLGLPLLNKEDDPEGGLAFLFKADPADPNEPRVLTGHANGEITINVAEADDAEREKRRLELREPYRTLLGHVRHEVGHYYWDRLIRDDDARLAKFRELFGDESADYGEALQRHYQNGAPADWAANYISSYATMHPWEDWAETWAHYLHMTDTLETAADCGIALRPARRNQPTLKAVPDPVDDVFEPFEELLQSWYPLTYAMNNLNRGMGLPDAYPFVLNPSVEEKLHFIFDVVHDEAKRAKGACPKSARPDSGSVIGRAMGWLRKGFPAKEAAGA